MTCIRYLILLCLSFLFACGGKPDTLFEQMAPGRTGVKFKNIIRETEAFHVMKYGYFYNGGGVAIGDVNNDGLADIYFTGNLVASRLYLNKGNWKFEEVAEQAGVSAEGLWNTGVTMADINGDGWLDIYVCKSAATHPLRRENQMFLNQGLDENGNISFAEMAVTLGIADQGYSTQATFFDYDRDGDLDMYLLNHSIQEYAGLSKLLPEYRKKSNDFYGDKLYRNELIPGPGIPPGVAFSDMTRGSGIHTNVLGFGLGISVADINRDGWPDIYVSNDYNENDYCYINQQDGTFKEQLKDYFDHVSLFSMGSDIADINQDGLPDLMTLDMLPEDNYRQKMTSGPDNYKKFERLTDAGFHYQSMRNMLQLNQGDGTFAEVGQLAGISNTDWSWATLFADFDLDGWQDVFITNGYERDYTNMDFMTFAANEKIKADQANKELAVADLMVEMPAIHLPNYIYKNNGDLSFTKMTEEWGLNQVLQSNGAAYGDLDGDGDLDLVVNNINEPAALYQNHSIEKTGNHYLRIQLKGADMNSSGIGGEVCLIKENAQNCQALMLTRGYQSSVEPVLTFGIGKDTVIERVEIRWPDGSRQKLTGIKADQTLVVEQDTLEPEFELPIRTKPDFELLATNNLFTHKENAYQDFDREILLPYILSTQGPKLTTGDINGDGKEDVFVGGAKGQAGAVLIQKGLGGFVAMPQPDLEADALAEDLGACFLDVDADGDLDLYVASGGNEGAENAPDLQDRLYLNDGTGRMKRASGKLPEMLTSTQRVTSADFDQDGDEDLFVGGRLVRGKYPTAPRSYLLENDGTGKFSDVTESKAPGLTSVGMVTDAVWVESNGDTYPDLMVVGEWMSASLFLSNKNQLVRADSPTLNSLSGWWTALESADMDGDGDTDFILGNHGWNSQIKATPQEPVQLYTKDFDKNGSLDPILTYFVGGESYPMPSRDDLLSQLPYLKGKYVKYEDYANQRIQDVFSPKELKDAGVLEAAYLGSIYLENTGSGDFAIHPLPVEAQVAPVFAIQISDVNQDGNLDAVLAGNLFGTRVKFGRYDANHGVVLYGDGKGEFRAAKPWESGLKIRGEVRDIKIITLSNGNQLWLFAQNNLPIMPYLLQKQPETL